MSGLEIAIPVISAVFALVSAFKDGGSIVEKIKDRRRRKGARLPNDKLQTALHQGAEQVQHLRAEGLDEFGDAFDRDAATAGKLKDVTIVLQDSIIRQLAAACNDDTIDDFGTVTMSVIQARKEAVNILNDLYMSLHARRMSPYQTIVVQPQVSVPRVQTIASQYTISEAPRCSGPSPPHGSSSPAVKTKRESWFGKLRRPSVDAVPGTQGPSKMASNTSPSGQELARQQQPQQGFSPASTVASLLSDGTPSPRVNRLSTTLSLLSPPHSPREWTQITKENKFAGLCRGAWYAQKMRLAKAMEPSIRDYEWLYHCRKCKFRLHGDASRKGNPQFDDRMQISGSVHFRLLFLWKSHVVSEDETRRYKCLLCIFGRGDSSIYKGEDHLFEHIARHGDEMSGDVSITGPIEVSSEGVRSSSIATFDFYIPAHPRQSDTKFMLPESAIEVDAGPPRSSTLFQDDPFENAWEHEGVGGL